MWCHASGMPVCDVMVAVKAKVVWRGGGSVHTQFQVPHGTLPARCSRPPISTSTTRYCCRCGTAVTDEQSHAVLPTISPGATFVITLAAMLVRSCLHTPWARQTRTPIDVPSLTRTLIQTHTHAHTHARTYTHAHTHALTVAVAASHVRSRVCGRCCGTGQRRAACTRP